MIHINQGDIMVGEIKWNDPTHQCYGCKLNTDIWVETCSGCYRQFYKQGLPDLYVYEPEVKPEMSYGSHKLLTRRSK